jgi:hypothetical protein
MVNSAIEKMKLKDYYKILEIPPTAGEHEIKKNPSAETATLLEKSKKPSWEQDGL